MTPALNAYEFVFLIFYHDGENDGENDNLFLILRRCRCWMATALLQPFFSFHPILFLPTFAVLSRLIQWVHTHKLWGKNRFSH